MRLPGAVRASIHPLKLTDYLLDEDHPVGGPKARFLIARGFRKDAPAALERALLRHPLQHDAVLRASDAFGNKYEVRCSMATPDGSDPCMRTLWRIGAEGTPYLVTAYPAR